ncbi:HEAT repeat domain-containing protein [Armatimonas rosea]|uniref:HEAT repeat protein n=1 Tax=Armatimonas rosea TaxID=685828 RepID=A0A7W9SNR2_ARMRO|nr:HEAT repeat domain-containing protein [Armatimonas rosea]MBB6050001.1 HEAT repeat protein [Armatimonas rosea]
MPIPQPATVAEAVALLRSPDAQDRQRGAMGLAAFSPPSASVVALLIEALADQERWVRVVATDTLVALGQANPAVVSALIVAQSHPQELVRRWLVEAIARAALPETRALEAVLRACDDPSSYVRYEAVNQLKRTKLEHPRLLPVLLKALEAGEAGAADALAVHQLTDPKALEALVQALQRDPQHLRSQAAVALGELGKATPEVTQGLFALASSAISYGTEIGSARRALVKLATQGHVRGFLQKKLRSRVLPESTAAALILAEHGVQELEVCQMLLVALEALDEKEKSVILSKLEPWITSVPEVALACAPLLQAADDGLRISAAYLLVVLPEYQEPAAETALAVLSPTNLWPAHLALQVLCKLPTLSEERQRRLLPHLISPPDEIQANPTGSAAHHYDVSLRSPLIGLFLKTPNLLPEVAEALESLGEEPCFLRQKIKKMNTPP